MKNHSLYLTSLNALIKLMLISQQIDKENIKDLYMLLED